MVATPDKLTPTQALQNLRICASEYKTEVKNALAIIESIEVIKGLIDQQTAAMELSKPEGA